MNKVMLIGNLGKDPVVRYYDADQAVAQFPLATTERGYTLPNGTQVPDRTDWHNIVLWKNLAKIAERYLHKGDKVFIEGKVRYRSYDDRKGQRQYITEIYADNMELLTPKPAGGQNVAPQAAQPAASQAAQPAASQAAQPAATQPSASAQTEPETDDSNLPF